MLPALGLLVVMIAGYLTWRQVRPPPSVTTVDDLDRYDSELVTMIERHVAAARQAPRDARARATLGLVYEANNLWSAARSCYRNATLLDSQEPMWPHHAAIAWLKMGDPDGARSWLQRYTKLFPSFAPMLYRYGVMLLDAGEIEPAQVIFQRVIALAPDSPSGYVALGDATLQADDPTAASHILKRALELDANDKMARYLLGRAYRALGKMEEAQRELTLGRGGTRRFISDSWSAYVPEFDVSVGGKQNRAASLLEQGKAAAAEEILKQILSADPENADALTNLGTVYLHLDRLEEARGVLERAAQLDTDRFEIYINLAACLRRMEQPTAALGHADRAVSLAPDVAQTNHARGLALMQLGSNEQALESLIKATSLDVQNARIRQDLANAYVRLGQHLEALEQFQVLARMLPTRWEPQLGLARMNLRLGRMDDAIAAVTAGLEMAPREPQLLALAKRIMESHGQ
jgi:tetratricopeptide (TPR) repeat protein